MQTYFIQQFVHGFNVLFYHVKIFHVLDVLDGRQDVVGGHILSCQVSNASEPSLT